MTREREFSTGDMLRALFVIVGGAMAVFGYKNPPTFSSAAITLAGIFIALPTGYWLIKKYFLTD